MTKHYQQKLADLLTFTLLFCGTPLLLSANALALENRKSDVATTEIAPLIAKLKSNDEREIDSAIEKLGKIGEPAIPALIQALGDKNLGVAESEYEIAAGSLKPLSKIILLFSNAMNYPYHLLNNTFKSLCPVIKFLNAYISLINSRGSFLRPLI